MSVIKGMSELIWRIMLGLMMACFLLPAPGVCQDRSTLLLLEMLEEKGIISEEEAGKLLEQIKIETAVQPEKEVRVITVFPEEKEKQYLNTISRKVARTITNDVKEQVKDEVEADIARQDRELGRDRSVPDWVRRIRWGGDIRLRYQGDYNQDDNFNQLPDISDPSTVINTTEDRERVRYRVRLKMNAEVNEHAEVGLRLATGNEENPISTNDTFGDYYNKDQIVLDRAYLKWTPIQEIELWGGRIPNPFFSTDLVWDSDLNLEGLALKLDAPLFNERWRGFLNAGAFPLQELELSENKWLYAGQIGFQYKPRADITFKLGAAYYDYENISGQFNDVSTPFENDETAPLFAQKGNLYFNINQLVGGDTLLALAAEYDLLNITGQVDLAFWYPIHVVLTGDYVKNTGYSVNNIARRTLSDPEDIPDDVDEGYQVGLEVGHTKTTKRWQWKTFLYYKYLEGDAVLDAFTDSDFHGGGTNAEGWTLGGQLGIAKNIWLSTKWMTADEIDGVPLAIDVWQFDVNAQF